MGNSITKRNFLEILKVFFIALIFLGIGSYVGIEFIPPSIRYYMNFAFFILVLFSAFSRRSSFVTTRGGMYIYSFVLGILTGSTYIYYFNTLGTATFLSVVIGVCLIFGLAYIVAARSSDENVFKMGSVITIGILVLLVLEFVNIFFFSFGTFDLILSALGIIIYTVYALFIMKSIQSRCRYSALSEGEIVSFAFSIFISFLNLLTDLLRLMSILNDD